MRRETNLFLRNVFCYDILKIFKFYASLIFFKIRQKVTSKKIPKRAIEFKSNFKRFKESIINYNYNISKEYELITSLSSVKINPIQKWKNLVRVKNYEVKLSFHRFYWLDFFKNSLCYEDFLELFQSWFIDFINERDAWHPYTSSERLTSVLSYLHLHLDRNQIIYIFKNENIFQDFICKTYNEILENLEYPDDLNTFNHVVNNYKGLILCGLVMDDRDLVNNSFKIMLNELSIISDEDCFFREGSSHYHLIIYKWLIELKFLIKFFNFKLNYLDFTNFSNEISKKASFFVVKGKSLKMPFFGDISPDFTPIKLLNLIFKKNTSKYYCPKILNHLNFFNSSNNSFIFKNYTRINKGLWTLFVKHNNCEKKYFPDHSHEDESQFVIFFDGEPLIIDSGRPNYETKFSKDKYCLNYFHNTARLNGISCFNNRNYPNIPNFTKYPVLLNNYSSKDCSILELQSDSIHRINFTKNDKYLRRFIINKSSIIIEDEFRLNKSSLFELSIQLSEKVNFKFLNKKIKILFNKSNLTLSSNTEIKNIVSSTYSESYNKLKNNSTLNFEKEIKNKFKNEIKIELST